MSIKIESVPLPVSSSIMEDVLTLMDAPQSAPISSDLDLSIEALLKHTNVVLAAKKSKVDDDDDEDEDDEEDVELDDDFDDEDFEEFDMPKSKKGGKGKSEDDDFDESDFDEDDLFNDFDEEEDEDDDF